MEEELIGEDLDYEEYDLNEDEEEALLNDPNQIYEQGNSEAIFGGHQEEYLEQEEYIEKQTGYEQDRSCINNGQNMVDNIAGDTAQRGSIRSRLQFKSTSVEDRPQYYNEYQTVEYEEPAQEVVHRKVILPEQNQGEEAEEDYEEEDEDKGRDRFKSERTVLAPSIKRENIPDSLEDVNVPGKNAGFTQNQKSGRSRMRRTVQRRGMNQGQKVNWPNIGGNPNLVPPPHQHQLMNQNVRMQFNPMQFPQGMAFPPMGPPSQFQNQPMYFLQNRPQNPMQMMQNQGPSRNWSQSFMSFGNGEDFTRDVIPGFDSPQNVPQMRGVKRFVNQNNAAPSAKTMRKDTLVVSLKNNPTTQNIQSRLSRPTFDQKAKKNQAKAAANKPAQAKPAGNSAETSAEISTATPAEDNSAGKTESGVEDTGMKVVLNQNHYSNSTPLPKKKKKLCAKYLKFLKTGRRR